MLPTCVVSFSSINCTIHGQLWSMVYTKKPKLIAVPCKTHGVKTINKHLRGNTAAERKQLTDYKHIPQPENRQNTLFQQFVSLFMVVLMYPWDTQFSSLQYHLNCILLRLSQALQCNNTIHCTSLETFICMS